MIPDFIDPLSIKISYSNSVSDTATTRSLNLYTQFNNDYPFKYENKFLIYAEINASYLDTTSGNLYVPTVLITYYGDFAGNPLIAPPNAYNTSSNVAYTLNRIRTEQPLSSGNDTIKTNIYSFSAYIQVRFIITMTAAPVGNYYATLVYGQLKDRYAIRSNKKWNSGLFR